MRVYQISLGLQYEYQPNCLYNINYFYRLKYFQPEIAFDKICQDERLKEYFIEEMRAIAKKEDLLGFEYVKNIYLEP